MAANQDERREEMKALRVLSMPSSKKELLKNDPTFDPLVDTKSKQKKLFLNNSSAKELSSEPDPSKIANPLAQKSLMATIFFSCIVAGFMAWFYYIYREYMKWCDDPTYSLPDTSIVNVGIPVFLVSILIEWLSSVIVNYETFRLNDTTAAFSNGLFQTMLDSWMSAVGEQLGVALITAIPYKYIFDNYRIMDINGTLGFICMFFGRDFCYYWFHYFAHRISFLWAVHGVHHQPNEFNFSVNLSQGAIQRITSAPFYLPLAFFMSPELYALVFPLEKVYGFMTHTKMVNKCYGLSYFFVTPSSHRIHHGGRPSYVIDRNFGEMLTIWDRMFGTFQEEQYPVVFGHVMPIETWDPLESQIATFKELYEKTKQTDDWMKKIWCFLGPPEYNPVGEDYELIDSHPFNTLKYDSRLPGHAWTLYATIHHIVTVAMGILLLRQYKTFDKACMTILMLYVTFSASNIGKLWDRNSNAISLEFIRLVLLPFMTFMSLHQSYNFAPMFTKEISPIVVAVLSLSVISIISLALLPPLEKPHETKESRLETDWVPEYGRRFKKMLDAEKKRQ